METAYPRRFTTYVSRTRTSGLRIIATKPATSISSTTSRSR